MWRAVLGLGAIPVVTVLAGSIIKLMGCGGAVLILYLRLSRAGTAFEAAGSLAVLLIGIYCSSQLFLAGAVFTRVMSMQSRST